MSLAKRIGKSETLRGLLCWLVAQYVRLVWLTGRWRVENAHIPGAFWDQGRPFILAFWHNRILMMPKAWRAGAPLTMLASQHRDGRMIARMVSHFGIGAVEGSSTRGGGPATRALLRVLKAGRCIGITPDGPKGPRQRTAMGVVALARLSGCPVIPAACATASHRHLASWDLFQVARPFTRGLVVWGEPIHVPRDLDEDGMEQWRLTIETALNAQAAEADRRMGVNPVGPA